MTRAWDIEKLRARIGIVLTAQWIEHPPDVREVMGSIHHSCPIFSLSHARVMLINRPFPNSFVPLFQNESKCETFHMKMSSACSHFMLQKPKISARWTSFLVCRLNLPYSRSVSSAQREKNTEAKQGEERCPSPLFFVCIFARAPGRC